MGFDYKCLSLLFNSIFPFQILDMNAHICLWGVCFTTEDEVGDSYTAEGEAREDTSRRGGFLQMVSREQSSNGTDKKNSVWFLDHAIDNPMDQEAGKLRNTQREKVGTFYPYELRAWSKDVIINLHMAYSDINCLTWDVSPDYTVSGSTTDTKESNQWSVNESVLFTNFILSPSENFHITAATACLPKPRCGLWRFGHISLVRFLQYLP